jgi:tetratricopeptide (TPR) repeat protein
VRVKFSSLYQPAFLAVAAAYLSVSTAFCQPAVSLSISGTKLEFVWVPLDAPDGARRVEIGDFSGKHPKEKKRSESIYAPFEQNGKRGYYLGKTEVTEEQWATVMGEGPRSKLPVTGKTYSEIQVFLERLNGMVRESGGIPRTPDGAEGIVKLPTEAEWEYAARGAQGPSYADQDPYGGDMERHEVFYLPGSDGRPKEVGSRPPGPLGLYDMLGNVRELMQENYSVGGTSGSGFLLKGGSYLSERSEVRSSGRTEHQRLGKDGKPSRRPDAGLRLCISADLVTALGSDVPRVALENDLPSAEQGDTEVQRSGWKNDHEQRKPAEPQSRLDENFAALQQVAESHFQQGQYDESSVLLARIGPLLTNAEDKKRNLYFLALTYALQNAAERAEEKYAAFQSAYKGDPIAANLPLAMGNLFLTHPDAKIRNPEKALKYFKEAAELYPKSPLLGSSVVNQAAARAQLGDFEGALSTYHEFLASNPPPAVSAVAQLGIGNVFKDQGKWDKALAAYKELVAKYPQDTQVEEAEFWVAVGTQQQGDNEASLPLIDAFLKKYSSGQLAPSALYSKASALLALSRTGEGVKVLTELADKFPRSQPAPFTYFQRAQIAGAAGNSAEVVRIMRDFADKYPTDDKIFFAYDSIGQTENNRGNTAAAIAAYREFLEKYSQAPEATTAMARLSDLRSLLGGQQNESEAEPGLED